MIEQRNDVIEHLNDVLKINDSKTEIKSLELLQNIFKINSQIKLEEDTALAALIALIVKRVVENEAR